MELICNSRLIIHVVPEEQDYDRVFEGLKILSYILLSGDMKTCWIYSQSEKLR